MIDRRKSYYNEIATEIAEKIGCGLYLPGEQLFSSRKLCEKYNISYVTACRVQNALVEGGYAYKINGKGMFVASSPVLEKAFEKKTATKVESPNIKKIVCFSLNTHGVQVKNHQISRIFHGVQQRAFDKGVSFRGEFIDISQRSPAFNIKDDEGIIIVSSGKRDYMMPLFANPKAKAVVIENIFPEAYCVLTDNYSGMMQLLDFLESRNCKKMVLATNHFDSLGLANLSERNYAFENECKRRGLDYQIVKSGNYKELIKIVKKIEADAVLFSADRPALEFKKIIKDGKLKHNPLVTGFDDWVSSTGEDTKSLTTVKVDFEQMGIAAVDIMVGKKLEDWCQPEIIRVPCKLIVRD